MKVTPNPSDRTSKDIDTRCFAATWDAGYAAAIADVIEFLSKFSKHHTNRAHGNITDIIIAISNRSA